MFNTLSRFRFLSLIFFILFLTSFLFFHHLADYSAPSSFDFYIFSKRMDGASLNHEQHSRILRFQHLLQSSMDHAEPSIPTIQWMNSLNHQLNDLFEYRSDQFVWNQIDYWASPSEFLIKGQGDCEDYAIFKYFFFRSMGMPFAFTDSLRLAYVQYLDPLSMNIRPHMVLFIYDQDSMDPWVIDNLTSEVHRLSKRSDLHFVFSFNHEHFFSTVEGSVDPSTSPTSRIKRWADVIEKSKKDGFN